MPMPKAKFEYDYEAIVKLSDWPYDRLMREVTDERVNPHDLASVCVWLAANGKPALRAALAAKLLPSIFGASGRRAVTNKKIEMQCSAELLKAVFEGDSQSRKVVAKKIGKSNSKP